jgi:hypothetical protein
MPAITASVATIRTFCNAPKTVDLIRQYKDLQSTLLTVKAEVEPIYQAIFETYDFQAPVYDDNAEPTGEFEKITDRKNLYECPDDDLCNAYFTACANALIAKGWGTWLKDYNGKSVADGHCPILVVESAITAHENRILEYFADALECPVPTLMADRKAMLDMFFNNPAQLAR